MEVASRLPTVGMVNDERENACELGWGCDGVVGCDRGLGTCDVGRGF